eukprot:6085683-Lingulodinium_polyedra.AAC.1
MGLLIPARASALPGFVRPRVRRASLWRPARRLSETHGSGVAWALVQRCGRIGVLLSQRFANRIFARSMRGPVLVRARSARACGLRAVAVTTCSFDR